MPSLNPFAAQASPASAAKHPYDLEDEDRLQPEDLAENLDSVLAAIRAKAEHELHKHMQVCWLAGVNFDAADVLEALGSFEDYANDEGGRAETSLRMNLETES